MRVAKLLAVLPLPLLISLGCGDDAVAPSEGGQPSLFEDGQPLGHFGPGWTAGGKVLVHATIPMTCVPAPPAAGEEPGIGPAPPCVVPAGLDERLIAPNPSGRARIIARDRGTRVRIELRGLAPDQVITAWLAYYLLPARTHARPDIRPRRGWRAAGGGRRGSAGPDTRGVHGGVGP